MNGPPEPSPPQPTPRLVLEHITKRYPSVVANDDVSLTVAVGEIHAVLGENGAGKSTLMKIIYGAVQPDAGTLTVDGQTVTIGSPAKARALGLSMVFQHLSLFESLTVAQNVWLGLDEGLSLAQVTQRIHDKALTYGLPIDPSRAVHELSMGERQRVEIIRALLTQPRLLILDEPTSVLAPQAVATLFNTLRQLAAEGCSILYISHKLEEIRALCHRCTVLRAGRVTGVVDPRTQTAAQLSRLMVGEEPPAVVRREQKAATPAAGEAKPAPMLQLRSLSLASPSLHSVSLKEASLELQAGEVLGIAGVSGSGQQLLLAALAGEDRRAPAGSITLNGQDVTHAGPRERREQGLHVVPEERLGKGSVPNLTLAMNTLLTRKEPLGRFGTVKPKVAATLAQSIIERFKVKASGAQARASSLSGGNLQKYIVGREIGANPRVLVVAQPTWGVDVGAASLIRRELLALRDAGCAVLVISEDLDELFELSDRLMVMAGGRLSPSLERHEATVERIGAWMGGSFEVAQEVVHAQA
jgi:general nucleoside transport system ATP-binding protein